MTEKKVYSDEEIRARIYRLTIAQTIDFGEDAYTAAMLQQLMEQRDEARKAYDCSRETSKEFLDQRDAVLKDLKALEAEVEHVQEPGVDTAGWLDIVDTKRSEKYDTETED